jgi:hypothetical protein
LHPSRQFGFFFYLLSTTFVADRPVIGDPFAFVIDRSAVFITRFAHGTLRHHVFMIKPLKDGCFFLMPLLNTAMKRFYANAKPIILNGVSHSFRKECMNTLEMSKRQTYKLLGEK